MKIELTKKETINLINYLESECLNLNKNFDGKVLGETYYKLLKQVS